MGGVRILCDIKFLFFSGMAPYFVSGHKVKKGGHLGHLHRDVHVPSIDEEPDRCRMAVQSLETLSKSY